MTEPLRFDDVVLELLLAIPELEAHIDPDWWDLGYVVVESGFMPYLLEKADDPASDIGREIELIERMWRSDDEAVHDMLRICVGEPLSYRASDDPYVRVRAALPRDLFAWIDRELDERGEVESRTVMLRRMAGNLAIEFRMAANVAEGSSGARL